MSLVARSLCQARNMLKKIGAVIGIKQPIHFIHRQHQRAADGGQDVFFQVARAAANIGAAPGPERRHLVI